MAEYKDREHFIPLRKSDLIELLCRDKKLPAAEREPFRQFCTLVSSVFHFEYLKQLEDLKDAYAPFDPDADTKPLNPVSDAQRHENEEQLFEKFTALMERANFKRLTREEMQRASQEVATISGVNTHVDLDMFDRLEVFVRGDVMGRMHRRSWAKLGKKEEIRVPLYQRLVLIVKLRSHKRLDRDIDTSRVYLKIFKDIPKADQDMLLPGARGCASANSTAPDYLSVGGGHWFDDVQHWRQHLGIERGRRQQSADLGTRRRHRRLRLQVLPQLSGQKAGLQPEVDQESLL